MSWESDWQREQRRAWRRQRRWEEFTSGCVWLSMLIGQAVALGFVLGIAGSIAVLVVRALTGV